MILPRSQANRVVRYVFVAAIVTLAVARSGAAQGRDSVDARARAVAHAPRESLPNRREVVVLGSLAAVAVLVSPFDGRWTTQLQRAGPQHNRTLGRGADVFRTLGSPGSLLITGSLFAIGRLTGYPGLTDAGLHAGEAVVISGLSTFIFKGLVGRARPLTVGNGDAGVFRPGRGFGQGYSSMPSGHATLALAAAASFSRELQASHPHAARVVTPLLYSAAALVAASRLYNNKHWASDVVAGAAIGTVVGMRVVRYAHAVPSSRLNRWRLPVSMSVGGDGVMEVRAGWTF